MFLPRRVSGRYNTRNQTGHPCWPTFAQPPPGIRWWQPMVGSFALNLFLIYLVHCRDMSQGKFNEWSRSMLSMAPSSPPRLGYSAGNPPWCTTDERGCSSSSDFWHEFTELALQHQELAYLLASARSSRRPATCCSGSAILLITSYSPPVELPNLVAPRGQEHRCKLRAQTAASGPGSVGARPSWAD